MHCARGSVETITLKLYFGHFYKQLHFLEFFKKLPVITGLGDFKTIQMEKP